jgi:hypothetical protein
MAQNPCSIGADHRLEAYATLLLGLADLKGKSSSFRLHKSNWFLVNRQDDTAIIAAHLVSCAGRIDHQSSRFECPIFVPLGTGENQDMFVSFVFMHRHLATLAVPDQSGRRSGDPVPVQPEDVYALFVRFPCDLILVIGEVKNVVQFKWERSGKRL